MYESGLKVSVTVELKEKRTCMFIINIVTFRLQRTACARIRRVCVMNRAAGR